MKAGPIRPLRLANFDSLDDWTDTALMSSVRPITAKKIDFLDKQSNKNLSS
jgi:hypothetical protein